MTKVEAKEALRGFYKNVLRSMGWDVQENGLVTLPGDPLAIATVHDLQLILPTDEWLREPDWDTQIPFHPLSENFRRKRSTVQEKCQEWARNNLVITLTSLLGTLVRVAVDTDSHDKLNAKQREFLKTLGKVDEKTYKHFEDLFRKIFEATVGTNELVGVSVQRDKSIGDTNWPRAAFFVFPIIAERLVEGHTIYGVKMRKTDKEAFFALLQYLLPDVANFAGYSAGTRTEVAPNFISLMSAYGSVMKQLNPIIKIFMPLNESLKDLYHPLTWLEELADDSLMKTYKEAIPPQKHNEGDVSDKDIQQERVRLEKKREKEEREERRRDETIGRSRFTTTKENKFSRREDDRDDRRDRRDDRDRDRDRPSGRSWRRGGRDDDRRRDYDDDYDDRRGRSRRDRDDYDDDRRGRSRRDDRDYDYDDDRRDTRRRGRDEPDENGVSLSFGGARRGRGRDRDDYDDYDDRDRGYGRRSRFRR